MRALCLVCILLMVFITASHAKNYSLQADHIESRPGEDLILNKAVVKDLKRHLEFEIIEQRGASVRNPNNLYIVARKVGSKGDERVWDFGHLYRVSKKVRVDTARGALLIKIIRDTEVDGYNATEDFLITIHYALQSTGSLAGKVRVEERLTKRTVDHVRYKEIKVFP